MFLVPLLLSLVLTPQIQSTTRPLVLTHVTIVDVTADEPIKAVKFDQAVVITGNRITAIGQASSLKIPSGAQVVDGGGRYLIPGLWDMHVHSLVAGRPDYFFPLFIANGVTGVRDMGGNLPFDQIEKVRDEINSGKVVGPRYGAVAGRILDGPGTRLNVATPVTDPTQAREIVRTFKQGGADFIKVYNLLSRDVYLAIIDEAKKQKLPVAGHVPFELSAAEVSELGQKSIEHVNDVFISASTDEKQLRQELKEKIRSGQLSPRFEMEIKLAAEYEAKRSKSLFARFVSNGTWQCPTLVVRRPTTFTDTSRLTSDVRMKYIGPMMRRNWEQTFAEPFMSESSQDQRAVAFRKTLEAVGAMQRAGVEILAGSDAPNPYVYPGFSLHDELALLVEAGLTPLQALRTATLNPAKYLGLSDSSGTIEKGKLADLVLLDANPVDDIRNTQRIQAVVANGRYFPHDQLRGLFAEAEAAAARH
jgi:hypothetical protein